MVFLFPLLFVAAILTFASAILAAIYFLLRDVQPQRDELGAALEFGNSGSLAMFAAMRLASSRVSNFRR